MNASRPILILTASAGAGHSVAAAALREAFERLAPAAAVEVHDVLQSTNRFFRTLYARGYLGLVHHAPGAMGWLYEATDRGGRTLRDGLRSRLQALNTRPLHAYLRGRSPRLIVNTHFLPAEIVARLRRSGRLHCPQITVTTDFETHRLWVQDPTELYCTATPEGKAYLECWGVDAARVEVTGIPVRHAFSSLPTRADARQACGLPADRAVVLLLCGGFGVGPTQRHVQELLTLSDRALLVVITGRNPRLQQELEGLAARHADCLRIVGYTEQMQQWMRAADLAVTKPGGLTASEALVCGLPLVITQPIPGQESRNSDYLLEHGAAIKVNNPRLLGFRVRRLLDDPPWLARLGAAARTLGRPEAAERIARLALSVLVRAQPSPPMP